MAMNSPVVTFDVNDLVWAKMKGFSPWPGRVVEPPKHVTKTPKKSVPQKCIFFFGSNNYAWIEVSNIKPYLLFKETLSKASKSAAFKEACEKIEEFMEDPQRFNASLELERDADAEFNKLLDSDNNTGDSFGHGSAEDTLSTPAITPKKAAKKRMTNQRTKSRNNSLDRSGGAPAPKRKRNMSGDGNNGTNRSTSQRSRSNSASAARRLPSIIQNEMRDRSRTPDIEAIDMNHISETLKSKNITPSGINFGFLGLGIMGGGIVKNLLNSGHKVFIWNRTAAQCNKFEDYGATRCMTPCDVVDNSDIIFSCVSDPGVAKEMVFGNCGVLQSQHIHDNRGYVEMTGIDAETSQDIADGILGRGGRYLEAQIQGSKKQAEEGTLIILAAGDRTLFDQCQTCFEAIGKNSFFLGDVGNASRMNLVLQMISGIQVAALAEAMALADRAGLQQKDVLEVLELTSMASPQMLDKGKAIIQNDYPTSQALKHLQKDLKLALGMSDTLEQPLPLTSTSNEVFKHAKRLGYGSHDASAVYKMQRYWRGL